MNFENLIIGAIILDPQTAGIATNTVTSEMFSGVNRTIFEAIEKAETEGRDIDLFLLNSEVDLTLVGGVSYLTSLTEQISNADRIKEYCLKLKEQHIIKFAHKFLAEGVKLVGTGANASDVINYIQKGSESIFEQITDKSGGLVHIKEITEKAVLATEERVIKKGKGQEVGVTTGLRALDRMLHYMRGGQLIVMGGRAAMGKTSVMLHMAKAAAIAGTPVCLYSLEMSDVSLVDRMIFSLANFNIEGYKTGDFTDFAELQRVQGELDRLPIYIDSNAKVSIPYIRTHTRMMKRKGLCGAIFIDYLQLADIDDKNRNREQEVAKASRQCKILAKELDVPVILLSQLSRAVEEEKSKRPELRHLRESGAIEQDADVVMFVYRAAYYGIDSINLYLGKGVNTTINSEGIGELIIAKQRDGAIGSVVFRHNESLTKLDNY